jgi:hypothetical protein
MSRSTYLVFEVSDEHKSIRIDQLKRIAERLDVSVNALIPENEILSEKAQASVSSMAEAIANTLRYLDSEIIRLKNKRMKLPVENVELGKMQKVQNQNEILRKECLAGVKE